MNMKIQVDLDILNREYQSNKVAFIGLIDRIKKDMIEFRCHVFIQKKFIDNSSQVEHIHEELELKTLSDFDDWVNKKFP